MAGLPTRRATSADIPRIVDILLAVAQLGALIKAESSAEDLLLVERSKPQLEESAEVAAVIIVRPGQIFDVYHSGLARSLAVAIRADAKRRALVSCAASCTVRFWPPVEDLGGTFRCAGTGRAI